MRRHKLGFAGLCALALLAPQAAFAHVGIGAVTGTATGLASGFAHPLTGLDHVIAMVLVGMLAWQLGGRAVWLVPSTFVVVMALAGALGMAGITLPVVEVGIALSLIALGAAVALGLRLPTALAMAMVGLFAIFHGHTHGTEMPENVGGVVYGLGFVLATALLHAAGIGAGFLGSRTGAYWGVAVTRIASGIAVCAGVVLLIQAI